jgi:OOP family OmpA-OmpF porin
MLTAIRNFVEDSFNVAQGDSLDALRFGGLALWIEQGSEAILAGVIRGNAPKELRLVFPKFSYPNSPKISQQI